MTDALVIGAGPAGLMAAEALAEAGRSVVITEVMPSPARKFLMAGKSGLNLTNSADLEPFLAQYPALPSPLRNMLTSFGPEEVMRWAEGLGEPLFIGSTGRVFPKAMKASPLLRRWLGRLSESGVVLHRRWRLTSIADGFHFATPEGERTLTPKVTVLALGGASWARLGSNGHWTAFFDASQLTPFVPSNVGVRIGWSAFMERHFGQPVKPIKLTAGEQSSRGEVVVSSRGLEGGGIYSLSPELRTGAPLIIDLMPDLDGKQLKARLSRPRGKQSQANFLRKAGLSKEKVAILREAAVDLTQDPEALSSAIKSVNLHHQGLRPIDEAISTAGGLRFDALTDDLMLKDRPGVFCAGEMLDWDAPTGGYLLTACLATGQHAGQAAAKFSGG